MPSARTFLLAVLAVSLALFAPAYAHSAVDRAGHATAISVGPAVLPAGTTAVDYTGQFSASGGVAPYSWAITGGSTSAGMFISSSSGAFYGRPTDAGTFTFTVTATDANGAKGSTVVTWTVAQNPLTVSPSTLPTAELGTPYTGQLTTVGGTAPYTYVLTGGSLPTGITFASDGTFGGIPLSIGGAIVAIQVQDAIGRVSTGIFSISTGPASALTITPATLPKAVWGVPYSATVSVSNGRFPYTYALASGLLPPGMTLSTTGTLGGAPTRFGSFTFSIRATDSIGATGTRAYTLVVDPPVVGVASPSSASRLSAYSSQLVGTGGLAPYTFAVASGSSLPPGLYLSSVGLLSGYPTGKGSFTFAVVATDANGASSTATVTMVINGAVLQLAPATLVYNATSGVFYTQAFTALGGLGPYTWTVSDGDVPAGLTMSSDGTLSGIPSAASGNFDFSLTATDANGDPTSKSYALRMAVAHILLYPAGLNGGVVGEPYTESFTAEGGVAPYSYSADGSIPPGLQLSAAGVLAGTPTRAGEFAFTVTTTDANGGSESSPYGLTVAAAQAKPLPAKPKVVRKKKVKKHAHSRR